MAQSVARDEEFTIPASAKGKQLKVKVTIKQGSQSSTKTATYKIK